MSTPPRTTERELIASFARLIEAAGVTPPGLEIGVGDDTAVFHSNGHEEVLLTKDVQVEGRHFQRRWLSGRDLGWRLAAVNLSDVAAMGGRPRYALLSLVVPDDVDENYLKGIVRGAVNHLARHGAALVGGNLSGTPGPLVCDMTLAGVCGKGKAWRRSGRAGDAIVVAGELGGAAAGLELLETMEHLKPGGKLVNTYKRPEPRVDVAELLRDTVSIHGAIDVSDGLSTDLLHMCRGGGVGCEINGKLVPVSKATESFCRVRGLEVTDWVMRGGEDYALLLSVASRTAASICKKIQKSLRVPARVIGEFTPRKGVYRVRYPDGSVRRIAETGWDHFRPAVDSRRGG